MLVVALRGIISVFRWRLLLFLNVVRCIVTVRGLIIRGKLDVLATCPRCMRESLSRVQRNVYTPKFLSKFPLSVIEIAKGNIQTTSFLGRFVFRLTSFHGNSRSSFPRDSHFRMSELLTTIFRCRAIFIRYVSVAGLLVCQPATVWGIRRGAFSKCTTKLLPELTAHEVVDQRINCTIEIA